MTIQISREIPLFNFERLDELCTRIGHPCQKLWPFKYLECFRCAILSVSIYYVPQFRHPCEKLWPFEFSRASVVQFRASSWVMSANQTSVWKVMIIWISRELPSFNFECLDILCPKFGHSCEKLWPFEFLESFRCSISSVSIYYVPNSEDVWKVMTIRYSRELPLFNFERLAELCPRIRHPCEKLW